MIIIEFNTFLICSFKFLNFLPTFSTLIMETCAWYNLTFPSMWCNFGWFTAYDFTFCLSEQWVIFSAFWKSSSFQRETLGFELQMVFPDSHSMIVLDLGSWPVQTPGFPDSSVGKESACNAGDLGSIPGSGRSAGEGIGYPLQHSGLENSMDCIVHGVARTRVYLWRIHFDIWQNQYNIVKFKNKIKKK